MTEIREEIAKVVWADGSGTTAGFDGLSRGHPVFKIADQILSIKGIRIETENQELPTVDPHNYSTGCPSCGEEVGTAGDVEIGMEILKAEGWVKCLNREEQ